MSYLGRSSEFGVRSRFIYTAAGSETSITGNDDNNNALSFTDGAYVDVYLNGVLLVPGADYNTNTANTIGGLAALAASDVVEVVVYDTFNVADTVPASTGGTFNGNIPANAFYGDGSNLTGIETVTKSATAPSSPTAGDIWYDTTNDLMKHWDGSQWLQMSNAFSAAGGTEVTSGGYKYHTFTTSDTFTVTAGSESVEYLIIAGGGGGGQFYGAGGGAGGVLSGTYTATVGSYSIQIGAGGAAKTINQNVAPNNGDDSTAFGLTAIGGGGGGGNFSASNGLGQSGGSGGGTKASGSSGGSGTSGQGNDGGAGTDGVYCGGGGGAGGPGGTGVAGTSAGDGGAGTTAYSAWAAATSTGVSGYYASGGPGGGGSSDANGNYSPGAGIGLTHATANTGSGGSGGGQGDYTTSGSLSSSNGGSGIVIIRYAV